MTVNKRWGPYFGFSGLYEWHPAKDNAPDVPWRHADIPRAVYDRLEGYIPCDLAGGLGRGYATPEEAYQALARAMQA